MALPLLQDADGGVQDHLLPVRGRLAPHDMHQGDHHVLLALMSALQQCRALTGVIPKQLSRFSDVAGVQRIDAGQAVTDAHHLTAHGLNDVDVVRLDIAQHHGVHPAIGQTQGDAPDQRGLTQAVETHHHG